MCKNDKTAGFTLAVLSHSRAEKPCIGLYAGQGRTDDGVRGWNTAHYKGEGLLTERPVGRSSTWEIMVVRPDDRMNHVGKSSCRRSTGRRPSCAHNQGDE